MARGRHGIVGARAAADLRAVQDALATAPAHLQELLDSTARQQLSAGWSEELARSHSINKAQEKFVTDGAEAIPYTGGLLVSTGTMRDKLGRIFEFGSKNRDKTTTYYRRGNPRRRASMVTRRATVQVPVYKAGGWIAYPAANRLGARVFNMWAELIHKVLHDATEGKR